MPQSQSAVHLPKGKTQNTKIKVKHIRIYYECEGGIEKSVPRITDWHHEACRVMTLIGDREGRIFLSPHTTNNEFIFLITT